MAKVFAFRNSAPSPIPALDSYAAILRRVFGGGWALIQSDGVWSVISARELLEGNPSIGDRIFASLANAEPVSAVILDLRPPPEMLGQDIPPRGLSMVGETLDAWFTDDSRQAPHLLLIVPNLLEPDAYQSRILARLVEAGRITVVAETGQAWLSGPDNRDSAMTHQRLVDLRWGELGRDPSQQPPTLLTASDADIGRDLPGARMSPVDLIRAKTIRRLGYFPRPRQGEVNRYFFDGQLCSEEIRSVIAEYLEGLDGPLVVHDIGVSRWLTRPLTAGTVDAGAKTRSLADVQRMSGKSNRQAAVVIVVPLVQTGESLTRALQIVRSKYPRAALHVFTVYSLIGPENHNGLQAFTHPFRPRADAERETIEVSYVSRIEQSIVAGGGMLPNVAYYAQRPDHFVEERFLSLTADDFWTMALESDVPFVPERNPPTENRTPLNSVPDLAAILKRNGPWISWKLFVACKELAGVDLREATLISVAAEEGSEVFSRHFELLFGNRPIQVPRWAIKSWQDHPDRRQLADWSRGGETWAADLLDPPSRDAVIVDEFAYSGETLRALAGLAAAAGLSIPFIGGLATFARSKTNEMLRDRRAFFLYETEIVRPRVA